MAELINEIKLFEGATKGEYNRYIKCGILADPVWENPSATTIQNGAIIDPGTYITNDDVLPIGIRTLDNRTQIVYYFIVLDTTSTEGFMKIVFQRRIYTKATGEWDIQTVQSIGLHRVENVQWAFIALDMKYKDVLHGKVVYLHTNGSIVASENISAEIISVFNTDDVVVNSLIYVDSLGNSVLPTGFTTNDSDIFVYINDGFISNIPFPDRVSTKKILNPIWDSNDQNINYMCDYYAINYATEPPSTAPPISPIEQYYKTLHVNANTDIYNIKGSSLYYKKDGKYVFGYDDATDASSVNAMIYWNYDTHNTKVIATQGKSEKRIEAIYDVNSSDNYYHIMYKDKDGAIIGRTKNYNTLLDESIRMNDTYYTSTVYDNVNRNICMGLKLSSNPRYIGMPETFFFAQYFDSNVYNEDESTVYAIYQDVILKKLQIIDAESTAWFLYGEDVVWNIDSPDDDDDDTEPDEGKDIEDEPIDDASLPSTSALDIGVIAVFNPTTAQMQSLAQEMQQTGFLDEVQKLYKNSPLEGIMSCHVVPIDVATSGSDAPHFGNWTFETTMPKVSEQFYTVNFGSIKLEKKFASFLDYSPYTRVQVYLPYIGYREIDVDDAMGKNIGVKYNFDIITGAILAQVTIDGSVHYQYSGSAVMQFPLTASNHNNLISSIVGLVTSGATTIAGLAVGGLSGGVGAAMAVGGAMSLASSAVHTVASSKPEIQHGGSFAMTNGFLSVKTPYLVVNRPNVKVPNDFAKYSGRMTNKTKFVSECSGYTEFASVDVNSLTALEDEKAEIESILKGGFYA